MRPDPTETPVLPPLLRIGDHRLSSFDRLEFEYELAEMVWGFMQTRGEVRLPEGIRAQSWTPRRVSGDLVAAGHGPNGAVRVLVGDMTGRGLAAALAAQPVVDAFGRCVQELPSAEELLRALNGEIRQRLPRGYFCAAALLELSEDRRGFSLWNCGLPDVWLLVGSSAFRRFGSKHPPLGVLDGSDLAQALVEGVRCPGEPLVICTDGVLRASALRNVRFGTSALHRALRECQYAGDPASAVLKEVLEFCWPKLPEDDATVVVID